MAKSAATGRAVFGLLLMALPGPIGRAWVGRDGERPGTIVLAQAVGARDLTVGLGALIAMRRGKPARGWFEAMSMADALDFVCAFAARDKLPPMARTVTLAVAAGAGAQAAYVATGVDGS
ncbi:MAG: hypothetical protein QOD53_2492 [Thermoleophilaceae bacterium]|nr:hypothetical protein [Thermoleophilaceae bacterium]